MDDLQESVGIAKALAAKNGYDLDPNQEVCLKIIFLVFYWLYDDYMAISQ